MMLLKGTLLFLCVWDDCALYSGSPPLSGCHHNLFLRLTYTRAHHLTQNMVVMWSSRALLRLDRAKHD
jgi:hypothetical protein